MLNGDKTYRNKKTHVFNNYTIKKIQEHGGHFEQKVNLLHLIYMVYLYNPYWLYNNERTFQYALALLNKNTHCPHVNLVGTLHFMTPVSCMIGNG